MQHFFPVLLPTLASAVVLIAVLQRTSAERQVLLAIGWVAQFAAVLAQLYLVFNVYGASDMNQFIGFGAEIAVYVRQNPLENLPEVLKLFLQLEADLPAFSGSDSTGTMGAISAILCTFLNDSLPGACMACGMGAFWGRYAMYRALRDSFEPTQQTTVLAAVLMMPSVLFWSAGVIKEAVVVGALGFAMLGARSITKRRLMGVPLLVGGATTALLVKPYIVLSALVGAAAFFAWKRTARSGTVRIRPLSLVIGFLVAVASILALGALFPRLDLANIAEEATRLQEAGNRGGSGFSLGLAEASTGMRLALSPLAILSALYRPTLLEAHNLQALVSAFETTALLLLSARMVFRLRYRGVLHLFSRHPVLVFCAIFTLTLSFGVGIATANLGTLSRYRMPLVPFFALTLMIGNVRTTNRHARTNKRASGVLRPANAPHRLKPAG